MTLIYAERFAAEAPSCRYRPLRLFTPSPLVYDAIPLRRRRDTKFMRRRHRLIITMPRRLSRCQITTTPPTICLRREFYAPSACVTGHTLTRQLPPPLYRAYVYRYAANTGHHLTPPLTRGAGRLAARHAADRPMMKLSRMLVDSGHARELPICRRRRVTEDYSRGRCRRISL